MKTDKNDKTKEKTLKHVGTKRKKATQEKITIQLEEINQKVLAKEGRLKRYQHRAKQYRQNRTFQINERKFYQLVGGDSTNTSQQPDARETEQFWSKIWQLREHNKKSRMDKQYDERVRTRSSTEKWKYRFTENGTKKKKKIKLENARPWWNTWILV